MPAPKEEKPAVGLQFPIDTKGGRSTTDFNKAIWAKVAEGAQDSDLAAAIQGEKNWRYGYIPHVYNTTAAQCASEAACLESAKAGLAHVHEGMEFVRDGKTLPLAEAMGTYTEPKFTTGTVVGQKDSAAPLSLELDGKLLQGDDLLAQVDAWVQYGCMEPSVKAAVEAVVKNPDVGSTYLKDRRFVMFGVGSALGPVQTLLSLGATVIAVATRRPKRWERLFEMVKETRGTLVFPVSGEMAPDADEAALAAAAGCDLMADTPEIRTWICGQPAAGPMVVGNYVYMDGEAHVRASAACDVIACDVLKAHPGSMLAYLGSPAMPVMINEDIHAACEQNYSTAPWWHGPLSLSLGRFQRNALPAVKCGDGSAFLTNGLVSVQGPNYATAKSIQMWRALVARSEGTVVSTNMAPPCRTESVVHVTTMLHALNGIQHFRPCVIFDSEAASPIMASLMLFDIDEANKSLPSSTHPSVTLRHPLELFTGKAVHGGGWRAGYLGDTTGQAAYMLGRMRPWGQDPTLNGSDRGVCMQ